VNFFLNEDMFKMFFGSFTINVVDPQIVFNDGFYDLVDVRIPEGTLLKPRFPAALSGRTHALGRIFDLLGALLGMGAPEQMLNAAGFSDSPHLFYSGYDRRPGRDGEWFQLFQIGFGGIPGRPVGDGPDGHSLWPGFTNVPNEFIESYFPLRIEQYEHDPRFRRRGSAPRRQRPVGRLSLPHRRRDRRPRRALADLPLGRARRRAGHAFDEAPGARRRQRRVAAGEGRGCQGQAPATACIFNTWGGGGWGDPLERDPQLVAQDVARRLVSVAGARRYGVVIDDAGAVDAAATTALREQLRADRGADLPLFNRGGRIEDIKARCLEETHLPAPQTPRFPDGVQA
jgi:N-methylhydantoinase B